MREINHFKIATIILAVALIAVLGYIAVDKFTLSQNQKMQQAYTVGYNNGVSDSVIRLYQDTENCGTTSIYLQNSTRYLADVDCLNKVLQQQAK